MASDKASISWQRRRSWQHQRSGVSISSAAAAAAVGKKHQWHDGSAAASEKIISGGWCGDNIGMRQRNNDGGVVIDNGVISYVASASSTRDKHLNVSAASTSLDIIGVDKTHLARRAQT